MSDFLGIKSNASQKDINSQTRSDTRSATILYLFGTRLTLYLGKAFINIYLGPSVIQLDPNIEVPSKAPAEQDFRKKRQPKESPKKVASDKATKALLGFGSKMFFRNFSS